MAKRGRPPKKTRLDKTKALGSAGLAGLGKGMKGLGRGISYGTAPLGLAFGVPNIKEGIEEGDVSKTFVGTGETLGGLYSLREIIRRLPAKSRSTAILKAINKGLDYIPGGKLARTLSKKRLPGEQTFRENPSLAVPSLIGLYGGEQAIDQIADVSRGKPADATLQEVANIFNVSPEALQPRRVVTQEPSEEEKEANLQKASLRTYEDADDRTGLTVNVPKTETVEKQAALTDEAPDGEDTDIPIIADDKVDTAETEEKEDITPNQEVDKTVEQELDPRQQIVSDTVSELDNMDLTISTGDGTDINNPKIVVGENLPEEESKIEPFSQKNMQATFDRLKEVDSPVDLIIESSMDVNTYEDAATKYKENALISMKLLKDFEAQNPRTKLTWDEYRNKFDINARDETKDFILLKFGLGLMSARTDLPGFSGFMDILGRVGAQSVDELQEIYQAERARQQRLRENFAQYEMQLEQQVRADKVNMLNSELGIFNNLNNSLMQLNIKKIDNDFQLNLKQMELEADLKEKLLESKVDLAELNAEITKDIMEANDLDPATANQYTNLFNSDNLLGGTHYQTAMSNDGKTQFIDSNYFERVDQNGTKFFTIESGLQKNFIPIQEHNRRALTLIGNLNKELQNIDQNIAQQKKQLITVTVGGKQEVLTADLFDKFKDTPQFANINEQQLNNNIIKIEEIKKLENSRFTVAGNIVQIQDSIYRTENASPPRKESVPTWMRGALTGANLAIGQTNEILALVDYAAGKGDKAIVGFRGRVAEMLLNLKDVANIGDQEAVGIEDINSEILSQSLGELMGQEIVDDKGNVVARIDATEIMERAEDLKFISEDSAFFKGLESKAEQFIKGGGKLSTASKRAIQTRLRVLETVLTFQLANALKQQDRLTEKNIEEARKLMNLYGFTGPGGVRNRVLATQKTIKERYIANIRAAWSSGMKEAEIRSLSENIYNLVKQENLNKRVSQYLNVPEKNIDSIQQELEKSIGE